MKRITLLATLGTLALALAGCGTAATHMMRPEEVPPGVSGVYRGVKFDTYVLTSVTTSDEREVRAFGYAYAPFYLCDLPISLAADTIMVPFDAFSSRSTNTPAKPAKP